MIEITKGKILQDNTVVEIEFTKRESADAKPAICSESHKDIPAKSLIQSFADLAIHAACITEFPGTEDIADIKKFDKELVKDFHVSSFSINGKDEKENVVITAQRTLSTGKVFGFSTPSIRFADESENAYPWTTDLRKKVSKCQDELVRYLNGNFGEDPQTKLPFGEPVTKIQVAEPEEQVFKADKLEKPSANGAAKKNRKTKAEEKA